MDWKTLLLNVVSIVPSVVLDVENTMHGASGADKKQKALAIALEGVKVADSLTPAHADQINAVTQHVGNIIDSVVNIFHITGLFQKKQAAAATPGT